jgi:hypothetical protein
MKTIIIKGKEIRIEMSMGWKGYGQYNIYAETRINDKWHKYKFHSTDSELYDQRKDDEISTEEFQEMLYDRIDTQLIEIIEEQLSQEEDDKEQYIDLFEDYNNIPPNVQAILNKYEKQFGNDLGDMDYRDMANMHDEIYAIGYTFDSGLDNMPYDLRPIGTKGKTEHLDQQ